MGDSLDYREKFSSHKVCVIIPTYNNAATLGKVIGDVLAFTADIIVVNDGSTDRTTDILSGSPVAVIGYPDNMGKGWALRSGFEEALKQGYDYAITIDADGQHFAADLPKFIDKLEAVGPAIIIGARNMDQAAVPGKSSFGHKFSNFWFHVETGIHAPDTQSGYRLYPLHLLKNMAFYTVRYEFEIEVLVRAAWQSIRIESVPVEVYYAPREKRVSHFRPFQDFSRISVLNTVLVILTILYINPRNFIRSLSKKETYRDLRKQVFASGDTKSVKAFSVGFGILMGILPIWGFQLALAIFFAIMFRLNKAIVILSANISLPPLIPLIIYMSYRTGGLILGEEAVSLDLDKSITLEAIHLNFMQYFYGSICLAFIAAIFSGLVSYTLLTIFKTRSKPL